MARVAITNGTGIVFTRAMAREVKAACRECCGGRRRVEIGRRSWPGKEESADGLNFLLWGSESDLEETAWIEDLIGTGILDSLGWIALDCYCYNLPLFGQEPDDALDTNVYVLIGPSGAIKYSSQNDLNHTRDIDRVLKENGHEGYTEAD